MHPHLGEVCPQGLVKIEEDMATMASIECCVQEKRNIGQLVRALDSFVIPTALKIDPCPGATGDGIDALRISDEELPSVLAGGDDGFIAVPDKPAEFVAAEIVPDVLHRIEFWRVGR